MKHDDQTSKSKEVNKRAFWFQGQYAIANKYGNPHEYARGRIVKKSGDYFYLKPFGEDESRKLHKSVILFYAEDGSKVLSETQIKEIIESDGQL